MSARETRKVFAACRARAGKLLPALKRARMSPCRIAEAEHAAKERQFAHVGCRKNTICYARAAHHLPREFKAGIIAHEFGHLAARGARIRETERDADEIGSAVCGVRIRRKGPNLEWAKLPLSRKRRRS